MFENFRLKKQARNSRHFKLKTNFSYLYYICFIIVIQSQCANCENFYDGNNWHSWSSREIEPSLLHEVDSESLAVIDIKFLKHDLTLSIGEQRNLSYIIKPLSEKNITNLELIFNSTNNAVLNNLPYNVSIKIANYTQERQFTVNAKLNGYSILTVKTSAPKNMTDVTDAFVRLSIHYSSFLEYLSDVVGWTYFFAWSISFYPQTYLNWRRKSVIGLHFDFLALNTIGFFVYSVFNVGLYFIPEIKYEYSRRHPFGVNPVQLNDVIFSIHAFFACLIQVVQCCVYERGDQRVSRSGRTLVGSIIIISIILLILGSSSVIPWLDFLYFLSYIKLFITLIKYIPQAYYNYLRKSTSGWSIGNIILDFTGGILSICQMFIISFNYNDWGSIFGDPTKFGLGLVSILFDIFFIIQHYILYKGHESYIPFADSPVLTRSSSSNSQTPLNYGTMSDN